MPTGPCFLHAYLEFLTLIAQVPSPCYLNVLLPSLPLHVGFVICLSHYSDALSSDTSSEFVCLSLPTRTVLSLSTGMRSCISSSQFLLLLILLVSYDPTFYPFLLLPFLLYMFLEAIFKHIWDKNITSPLPFSQHLSLYWLSTQRFVRSHSINTKLVLK